MIKREPQPEGDEQLRGRLRQLTWLFAAGAVVVLLRVAFLNVFAGEVYSKLASENYHSTRIIDAPRGRILDRHGRPLATNRLSFDVVARAYRLKDEQIAESLRAVAELTGRDFSRQFDALTSPSGRKRPQTLFSKLDFDEAAPVLERVSAYPGVGYEAVYRRYYPHGVLASHALGYIGMVNRRELDALADEGYTGRDYIGKTGLERLCEDALRGVKGEMVYRHDAGGRVLEEYPPDPAPQPGDDVALTLDLDLQRKAEEILDEYTTGVLIALDPNTGAVLAMTSRPTFDPNRPGRPLGPDIPTSEINLAVRGAFMPGSAFKLVTAYAALRQGVDPAKNETCTGKLMIPGWNQPYRCDARYGHGAVDMVEAIQKSCNVFFYQKALTIGQTALVASARHIGLGAPTGVDCAPREPMGVLPDHERLYTGELLHMAIGQGKVGVTPLQMLRCYAALANGGLLVRPYTIERIGDRQIGGTVSEHRPPPRRIEMRPEWRRTLIEGLWRVVNAPGGTAHSVDFPKEWDVCGKTSSVERYGHDKTNAWFVCFAPRERPVVAVLAMVENIGHGGSFAAPMCKEFLEEYWRHFTLSGVELAPVEPETVVEAEVE